jgi:hypothetical protein
MFDYLDSASARTAVPAGHYAIQFIRQWAKSAACAGLDPSFEGLPADQLDLAKRIVSDVASLEHKPVQDIPQDRIDDYVKLIAERILRLSFTEHGTDPERGRAILAKLRSVQ